jgi:hypothetical protein
MVEEMQESLVGWLAPDARCLPGRYDFFSRFRSDPKFLFAPKSDRTPLLPECFRSRSISVNCERSAALS